VQRETSRRTRKFVRHLSQRGEAWRGTRESRRGVRVEGVAERRREESSSVPRGRSVWVCFGKDRGRRDRKGEAKGERGSGRLRREEACV